MNWSDYYMSPITLNGKSHPTYIEGLTVYCDNLHCKYTEMFIIVDGAETAAEIHESQEQEP